MPNNNTTNTINRCVNGQLDGYEFPLTSSSTSKITYKHGYYLKSALREGENITLWVWHRNDEKPIHPITPQ